MVVVFLCDEKKFFLKYIMATTHNRAVAICLMCIMIY